MPYVKTTKLQPAYPFAFTTKARDNQETITRDATARTESSVTTEEFSFSPPFFCVFRDLLTKNCLIMFNKKFLDFSFKRNNFSRHLFSFLPILVVKIIFSFFYFQKSLMIVMILVAPRREKERTSPGKRPSNWQGHLSSDGFHLLALFSFSGGNVRN